MKMEGKRCEACAPELTRNKIKKKDRLLHINSFDLLLLNDGIKMSSITLHTATVYPLL